MKFLRPSVFLALAAAAFSASAQTVDFEDLAAQGTSNASIRSYGGSLTSGGFVFTATGTYGLASFDNNGGGGYNYTGSVALFNNTNSTTVAMTKAGGGAFSLASLQVASLFPSSGSSSTFTFLGTRTDGTTVSQTTLISNKSALTTVTLTGFTNLATFTLPTEVSVGPYYQFDNIVATPVPEPSALLALGLPALALLRHRKRC